MRGCYGSRVTMTGEKGGHRMYIGGGLLALILLIIILVILF